MVKYCPDCGRELCENARFCDVCGIPQSTEPRISQSANHGPLQKKESLNEFVIRFDKLLTAFGVFTALTAIFFQLHHPYLTLVGYVLVILILWELMSDKSTIPPSSTLWLFTLGFIAIFAGLTLHLVMGISEIHVVLLPVVIGTVLFMAIIVGGKYLLTKLKIVAYVTSAISSRHVIGALQLTAILAVMGLVLYALPYLIVVVSCVLHLNPTIGCSWHLWTAVKFIRNQMN